MVSLESELEAGLGLLLAEFYIRSSYNELLNLMRSDEELKDRVIAAIEAMDVPLAPGPSPLPAGVLNHGNTCYLSTVLVSLVRSPPILSAVLSSSSPSSSSLSSLQAPFSELITPSPSPVDATKFYESFDSAFDASSMGDAYTTYLKFMDIFSPADRARLFEGKTTSTSNTEKKTFTSILLPLSPPSLLSSLTKTLSTTNRSISSPPKSLLTFHLKRFTFDVQTQQKVKQTTPFTIPDSVTLDTPSPSLAATFTLSSFIAHTGEASGGHFVACVKINGSWFQFDDENVTSLSSNPSLLSSLLYENSCLLFYTRPTDDIDANPTVPPHLQSHISQKINQHRRMQLAQKNEKLREFLVDLLCLGINSVAKFQLDGNALVGRRVEVKWTSGLFRGTINYFDSKLTKFHVKYEDGAENIYKLHKKEFRFIDHPATMSSSSSPPPPPPPPIDLTNIDPSALFKKLCQRQYNAIIQLVNKQSIHSHLKKDGPLTKVNNGNSFLVNVPNLLPLIDHAASQDVASQVALLDGHSSDLRSLFSAISSAPNDQASLAQMKERIELGERAIICVKDKRSSQEMKTVALLCLKHGQPTEFEGDE